MADSTIQAPEAQQRHRRIQVEPVERKQGKGGGGGPNSEKGRQVTGRSGVILTQSGEGLGIEEEQKRENKTARTERGRRHAGS